MNKDLEMIYMTYIMLRCYIHKTYKRISKFFVTLGFGNTVRFLCDMVIQITSLEGQTICRINVQEFLTWCAGDLCLCICLFLQERTFYDSRNLFDQHRDMRLDIDNMSYEVDIFIPFCCLSCSYSKLSGFSSKSGLINLVVWIGLGAACFGREDWEC